MKKLQLVLIVLLLSSCGQIQRILDGTESLPAKLDKMGNSTAYVEEGVRKQKQAEALAMATEEKNRANLVPIPFGMMAPTRTLAGALTADEAVLFFKNYLLKINKQQAADSYPAVDEEKFQHERIADYYMLILIAGFLPDETMNQIIKVQSNQGAYQEIMFAILKMRADFNSDIMLTAGVLGLNPNEVDENGDYKVIDKKAKLDTLGKIEVAMGYNDKVQAICDLDFADKVYVEIEGFELKPLDKEKAKKNWQLILKRAESDYAAQSLQRDPKENEAQVKEYADRYAKLLETLKQKSQ
ncbi:MAG: hypothetical protein K2P92_06970 [Bdellovibrionaceae bacterium]|nr:hypothetical protein [Pseudobdellovibrionaceae bacterium]